MSEERRPVKVADQHARHSAVARFNSSLALGITRVVGSMWCAYVFAVIALISLPTAIRGGTATLIAWIAQTFIQLVLLSIIMVGQDVQARAADARAEQTFEDAEALKVTAAEIQARLAAVLEKLEEPRG